MNSKPIEQRRTVARRSPLRLGWGVVTALAALGALAWSAQASVPTRSQHLAAIQTRMATGLPMRDGVDSLFRQNGLHVMYNAPWGLYSYACVKDCMVISWGVLGRVYIF